MMKPVFLLTLLLGIVLSPIANAQIQLPGIFPKVPEDNTYIPIPEF